MGFDDSITSSCDAIAKHVNHPSDLKIKDMYKISDDSIHFMSVDVSTIDKKLWNIDNKKSQGYDNIPGNYYAWLIRPWLPISRTW